MESFLYLCYKTKTNWWYQYWAMRSNFPFPWFGRASRQSDYYGDGNHSSGSEQILLHLQYWLEKNTKRNWWQPKWFMSPVLHYHLANIWIFAQPLSSTTRKLTYLDRKQLKEPFSSLYTAQLFLKPSVVDSPKLQMWLQLLSGQPYCRANKTGSSYINLKSVDILRISDSAKHYVPVLSIFNHFCRGTYFE